MSTITVHFDFQLPWCTQEHRQSFPQGIRVEAMLRELHAYTRGREVLVVSRHTALLAAQTVDKDCQVIILPVLNGG